ncbi:MAG: NAD(P)-dependent oxidoreductase [Rhodothermales bacterium]
MDVGSLLFGSLLCGLEFPETKQFSPTMSDSVGFIGLGIMGRGMAHNLLKNGVDLTVWNRTPARMEPLAEAGAGTADSPGDLASRCDIVITCVSDTPDVVEVVEDILDEAREGSLVIDMSTISPSVTRELNEKLNEKGIHMLDAPISGGSEGAADGTLSIMVGGAADQVDRAMPYFEAMGSTITHVGGNGAGQTVKLVNQVLVVINMLAVSEALTFAEAGGLDLEKTLQAVSGGAAGSWMLSNRGPQCVDRDWRPGFTIDLQQKDLRLVLDAADELVVPALGTSTCFHYYRTLQQQGLGAEGNHALIKALEHLSGIEVGG